MCRLSPVAVRKGLFLAVVTDFSLLWLLSRSTGSGHTGFSSLSIRLSCCGSQTAELRLRSCGTKALVALWHVGSSQARDQMCVPFMDRWISIHCTIREVSFCLIFLIFFKGLYSRRFHSLLIYSHSNV